MNNLSPRERELVALGASLGSNCVPCIEYHIPEARKAGLSDSEISAAVRIADQVRQVPARKVLDTALGLLGATTARAESGQADRKDAGCASATAGAGARSAAGGNAGTEGRCCS